MLSVPSATGAGSKMLRYGIQKTGHPSALPDAECRKRIVAGKMTPLDSAGADPAYLLAREAFGPKGVMAAMAVVAPSGSGIGRMEMRGARAPPLNLA